MGLFLLLCKMQVTQDRVFLQPRSCRGFSTYGPSCTQDMQVLLERNRAFRLNPFLLWLHPALYSENLNCHENTVRWLHFTAHARKAEISIGALIIMYFRRGKMNCWGGERLDTSNAKNVLFIVLVINSVHGLVHEYLTCSISVVHPLMNVLLMRHPSKAVYPQSWHQSSVWLMDERQTLLMEGHSYERFIDLVFGDEP